MLIVVSINNYYTVVLNQAPRVSDYSVQMHGRCPETSDPDLVV